MFYYSAYLWTSCATAEQNSARNCCMKLSIRDVETLSQSTDANARWRAFCSRAIIIHSVIVSEATSLITNTHTHTVWYGIVEFNVPLDTV